MIGSLFAGISGLNANATALTVIGDNIANVNTTSFKSNSSSFANVLSQSLEGSSLSGIGRGVQYWATTPSWSQGSLESTNNPYDLAINGRGFFILSDDSGSSYYSRAGAFSLDREGNLTNPDGFIVQGYEMDSASEALGSITDIVIPVGTSLPQATSEMYTTINLDANAAKPGAAEGVMDSHLVITAEKGNAGNIMINLINGGTAGSESVTCSGGIMTVAIEDGVSTQEQICNAIASHEIIDTAIPNDPGATWELGLGTDSVTLDGGHDSESYSTTITAYDSLGSPISLSIDFNRNSTGWDWSVSASDGTCNSSGSLVFDTAGQLIFPSSNPLISITGMSSGASPLSIEWHLTDSEDSITGYSSPSNTTFLNQNGYPAGTLQSVAVDEEGIVTGSYTNGQLSPLYQIALADFRSYNGLVKIGENLYAQSLASGDALPGTPGGARLGTISPSSLEMSNVDLAQEFVKMITTQRAFQASSKIITTSDEVLSDLISIKR